MAWAEDYRQKWIAESIRVFGYINRYHLVRKFGISDVTASLDFKRYMKDNPGQIIYSKEKRTYVSLGKEPRNNI